MVRNENGQVAVRFVKLKNHLSKLTTTLDKQFHFTIRAGTISMGWVDERYLNRVLALEYSCCGNPPVKNLYRLATQQEADAWLANDSKLLQT